MKIEAAVMSDIGLARKQNQDNFFLAGKTVVDPASKRTAYYLPPNDQLLFVAGVFDGMGGEKFGEVASRIAVESFGEHFSSKETKTRADVENVCLGFCHEANKRIFDESSTRGMRMGTTAAFCHIQESELSICNVGDSRIHIMQLGKVAQLSEDHTEANLLLKAGIKPNTKKGRLAQYLGINPEDLKIEPCFKRFKLQAGDCILICSDGISDYVDDEILERILSKPDIISSTSELVQYALAAGGKDNITALVIRVR